MMPMLARPAEPSQMRSVCSSDTWVMQPKIDGHRRIVTVNGGDVTGTNRKGAKAIVPRPVATALEGVNATLDGELLGDTFVAFDVLALGDTDVTGQPLTVRLDLLGRLFSALDFGDAVRLCPTAVTVDEKRAMVDRVTAGNGEGWMAKAAGSTYRPDTGGARNHDWLKIKRVKTVDVVVEWIGTEKRNMGLTMYDPDGNLIEGRGDGGGVAECTRLAGDGMRVREGDVVEVQFLYATDPTDQYPWGRLYQPTKPRLRDDKDPHECVVTELAAYRTNKNLVLDWSTP